MNKKNSLVGKRGLQPQTCKVCGHRDKFNFSVPDKIWELIVPSEYQTRVVCLSCFDGFAAEKNIEYVDYLRLLCFAGDKASFDLVVRSAVSV